MRRTFRFVPLAMAAALLLGACGNDADGGAADDAGTAAEPEEEAAEAESTEADEPDAAEETEETEEPESEVAVAVATTDLGDVLVDADGMTLYLFTPDTDGESTCYDDCEAAWPPLTVDGEPGAGDGADASQLGTTERDDGSMQVTYNGWPLYRWQGDEAPGDVTGQNVNEVWFAVSPDGEAISETASAADEGIGY